MEKIFKQVNHYIDKLVSLIIFLVTLRLVLYMITDLMVVIEDMFSGKLWLSEHDAELMDWIVFYIVMVKAYNVLISYTKYQHVSVRYVTELVILSCFVEFIFERDLTDHLRVVIGTVGICSLFIYLYFYETIKKIDDHH